MNPPSPDAHADLVVRDGELICYRLIDLGDEVLLDEAEQALLGGEEARRITLSRTLASALVFKARPLDVLLPSRVVRLPDGSEAEARVTARFFDIGIASVRFVLPIPPETRLADLTPLLSKLYEHPELDAEGRRAIELLRPSLGEAIRGEPACEEIEPYTVVFVRSFVGDPSARQVLAHRQVLAKLLLGEVSPLPLAESELDAIDRFSFSYFDNDLAVVDWDGALVLEPQGNREVTDVLEFACAQTVGLRGYDALIDRELEHFYDHVQAAGGFSARSLLWSPYATLAKRVQERWLDATEFTDRTENALKVVADLYLARVYRAALERSRVAEWQAAITKKQARIAQVYEFLKGEVDSRRATFLEVAIVVLILVEILLVFV
ncbi:MAG: hypothetical protein KDD82_23205 [Planctomycetes bacterium]|nr:hypothetical protein [Planctomycetota bacterium]